MKSFLFRGKSRLVGALRLPSPIALAEQAAKGWFHDIFPPWQRQVPYPATTDYLAACTAAQATMLRNDVLGCCAPAADLHIDASRCANAGAPYMPTNAQVTAAYSGAAGYVEGDPSTDQGTDPLALMRWRKTNAYPSGVVLLDAINVDATSRGLLSEGIWLPTGALAYAALPDAWESEEDAGDVWDVAGDPNPANGHMFGLLDYDADGPIVETWGEQVHLTWAAAAKYLVTSAGGGVLAPLASDCVSKMTEKCPAGFDLSGLTSYLDGLGTVAS